METTPPPAPAPVVLALTTLPPTADADAFVQALLERRLVACGTLLPGARSLYHWQGQVEHAAETVVLLKTTAPLVPLLREHLPSLHPYEVPELLVLSCADGLPAYLQWVRGEVASG
jgi:periplasmic divalent cation tolerance protein